MKKRYLLSIAVLTLVAGVASAGLKQPAPVAIITKRNILCKQTGTVILSQNFSPG